MASIDMDSGRGGKKAVDANIPLIPFIDLLLCCVMFLLVTAVWNQLAGLDTVQNVPGERSVDQPPRDALRLVLQLQAGGYVLSSTAGDRVQIPKVNDSYDVSTLRDRLAAYREAEPVRRDLTLAPDDGVAYDALVQAMDAAAAQGFVGFSVSGT
jgi:biopolymer transport protein ExbD